MTLHWSLVGKFGFWWPHLAVRDTHAGESKLGSNGKLHPLGGWLRVLIKGPWMHDRSAKARLKPTVFWSQTQRLRPLSHTLPLPSEQVNNEELRAGECNFIISFFGGGSHWISFALHKLDDYTRILASYDESLGWPEGVVSAPRVSWIVGRKPPFNTICRQTMVSVTCYMCDPRQTLTLVTAHTVCDMIETIRMCLVECENSK